MNNFGGMDPLAAREEIETLNRLRSAVLYGGLRNSLVEWMLSDLWCQEPAGPMGQGQATVQGELSGREVLAWHQIKLCNFEGEDTIV